MSYLHCVYIYAERIIFSQVFYGGNFMRTLQTLIFLLFFSSLFGQNKTFYNIVSENGDTTFWFKYQQVVIKELSLLKLDTSTNSFYFRLWKGNQVIDIWENDKNLFSGQITSWTSEYVPNGEKPTGRTQINKQSINVDTVKRLVGLIKSSNIINLPTDNLIKGWKQGFDGITYLIEYSTKDQYSFKTYWTPYVQDTLSEAKLVQSFVDDFFKVGNAKNIWELFTKSIPYECFINGGNIACRVLTKKEKRKYAKERKSYRQRIKVHVAGSAKENAKILERSFE